MSKENDKKQGRIQKTFVVSRKSLSSLDEISSMFNASSYETVKDHMESFIDRSKDIEKFDADNMNP
ncbi:MAG: hypothetical protein JRF31_07490 [Deltaproteobacteria bacterium]|nr:hypothetical protein [Deltaproteobacteria bacterium]MBW1957695.1 hypothetical protein [Deltaproteobacteria bacterium]MBW2014519.1 hypothetical protein [Deltaproteobacteria bacterium]MBW2089128.1 hypothetical protein [Deltaproteobacteria bacterium]MBW2320677.1 hypothetical protein [Deltaproteobacteria bacterium]